MTTIVIDRVPVVKADLLEAVRELEQGFAKLVELAESLPQPQPESELLEMSQEDREHFGQLSRQLIWCRMYSGELSGREDSRALPRLIDHNRNREQFEDVQWLFTCVNSLDGLVEYAKELAWKIILEQDVRYNVIKLLELIEDCHARTNRLISRLEDMAPAVSLSPLYARWQRSRLS